MRVEKWCGYDIRFVEVRGEWWAILKDICDALGLRTAKISERLDSEMLERVQVECVYRDNIKDEVLSKDVMSDSEVSDNPSKVVRSSEDDSNEVTYRTQWMLAVNEEGIYEALFTSRKLEARKFRRWSGRVMRKLRQQAGLQGYEVMKMTDPKVQEDIDHILDTLFYDEETGKLMQSVTVQGGDVDQVLFLD